MTENIDPNDIEDCQKQVFDLEAEVRELRAANEQLANELAASRENHIDANKRNMAANERAERAEAALERERTRANTARDRAGEIAGTCDNLRDEVARLRAALVSIADILDVDDMPATAKQLRAALRQPGDSDAE